MCSSSLHWRRQRNSSFKTTKVFKANHTVGFSRDFTDNRLRAVCSCGWSASLYLDDHDLIKDNDPMAVIRERGSEHLKGVA